MAYDINDRAQCFSVLVIRFVDSLPRTVANLNSGRQLVRSATSIGANLIEAKNARSKKEFISCVAISLKEAEEAKYWLSIICRTSNICESENRLITECQEIVKILVTIIKNSKRNLVEK